MTVKDWIYQALTVGCYLVAVIAGLYARNKGKINKLTLAGKVMEVVGQLATYAVHEAERTELNGASKRKRAEETVSQGLDWLGIKGVTPTVISGAIEDAVAAMKAASKEEADQPAEKTKEQAVSQPAASQQAVDQPAEAKEVTNGK